MSFNIALGRLHELTVKRLNGEIEEIRRVQAMDPELGPMLEKLVLYRLKVLKELKERVNEK